VRRAARPILRARTAEDRRKISDNPSISVPRVLATVPDRIATGRRHGHLDGCADRL